MWELLRLAKNFDLYTKWYLNPAQFVVIMLYCKVMKWLWVWSLESYEMGISIF